MNPTGAGDGGRVGAVQGARERGRDGAREGAKEGAREGVKVAKEGPREGTGARAGASSERPRGSLNPNADGNGAADAPKFMQSSRDYNRANRRDTGGDTGTDPSVGAGAGSERPRGYLNPNSDGNGAAGAPKFMQSSRDYNRVNSRDTGGDTGTDSSVGAGAASEGPRGYLNPNADGNGATGPKFMQSSRDYNRANSRNTGGEPGTDSNVGVGASSEGPRGYLNPNSDGNGSAGAPKFMQSSRDYNRAKNSDVTGDPPRDGARDSSRDTGGGIGTDTSRDTGGDTGMDSSRDTVGDIGTDSSRDTGGDIGTDSSRDTGGENAWDTARENSREKRDNSIPRADRGELISPTTPYRFVYLPGAYIYV